MKESTDWIFYLQLNNKLNDNYLNLDKEFKNFGRSLVPIRIEEFLNFIKKHNKVELIVVVKSKNDLRRYNQRIKKILRLLLLSKKIRLYLVSSFRDVNDLTMVQKNHYLFYKLPMKISDFACEVITNIIDRESDADKWPGASRPKIQIRE